MSQIRKVNLEDVPKETLIELILVERKILEQREKDHAKALAETQGRIDKLEKVCEQAIFVGGFQIQQDGTICDSDWNPVYLPCDTGLPHLAKYLQQRGNEE